MDTVFARECKALFQAAADNEHDVIYLVHIIWLKADVRIFLPRPFHQAAAFIVGVTAAAVLQSNQHKQLQTKGLSRPPQVVWEKGGRDPKGTTAEWDSSINRRS